MFEYSTIHVAIDNVKQLDYFDTLMLNSLRIQCLFTYINQLFNLNKAMNKSVKANEAKRNLFAKMTIRPLLKQASMHKVLHLMHR